MGGWAVYCLVSADSKRSYIGATVDVERRLRQHNGELVGGAKATAAAGSGWKRVLHVLGFPDQVAALQFEWKWKYIGRKMKASNVLEKRLKSLVDLVNAERSTQTALPYSDYPAPLVILCETQESRDFLEEQELRYAILDS